MDEDKRGGLHHTFCVDGKHVERMRVLRAILFTHFPSHGCREVLVISALGERAKCCYGVEMISRIGS